jgi:hypothetical protein
MRVRARARVRAPIDDVAAALNDAELAPRWQRDLERMEVVRGAPNEVGALARLHYVEKGRAYIMEDELLECDPDRRWRSRVSGNGVSAVVETRLTAAGDDTDVDMTWSGRPDALWARPLFYALKPIMRRRMRADLDALARLLAG